MNAHSKFMVAPAKWVKPEVFEAMTGYTVDAQNSKRKNGVWEEGVIWKKAPDGKVLFCPRAYEEWVEQGFQKAS